MRNRFMTRMIVVMTSMIAAVVVIMNTGSVRMHMIMGMFMRMFMGMAVGMIVVVRFAIVLVVMAVLMGVIVVMQMRMIVFSFHRESPFIGGLCHSWS